MAGDVERVAGTRPIEPIQANNLYCNVCYFVVCCHLVPACFCPVWLDRLVVERRTREVVGSSRTLCSVVYGPGQADHAPASVTKQYNLVLVEGR